MKLIQVRERFSLFSSLFLSCIHLYQLLLSPFLGRQCRYYPTCSRYAEHCFQYLPFWKACYLTGRRILRCHPYAKSGNDYPPGFAKSCCEVDSLSSFPKPKE